MKNKPFKTLSRVVKDFFTMSDKDVFKHPASIERLEKHLSKENLAKFLRTVDPKRAKKYEKLIKEENKKYGKSLHTLKKRKLYYDLIRLGRKTAIITALVEGYKYLNKNNINSYEVY